MLSTYIISYKRDGEDKTTYVIALSEERALEKARMGMVGKDFKVVDSEPVKYAFDDDDNM